MATEIKESRGFNVVLRTDQVSYLDRLSLDIRDVSGANVDRSTIIRGLIEALRDSGVSLDNCTSEEEVTAAIMARMGVCA